MRKILSMGVSACMLVAMLCTPALAAPKGRATPGTSGSTIGSSKVVMESGSDIELHGNIEPTIISVTVPSYIPFSMSRSLTTENKVVSPKIDVLNHSTVPVNMYVDKTKVDLASLPGAIWSSTGRVTENQVAIGMTSSQTMPEDLDDAAWLLNGRQHTNISTMPALGADRLFLVGTLGADVPENRDFTVIATLVVRAA